MRRNLIPAALAALLFPGLLYAEAGTTGGQTLARPLGARSCGMGQAFTAIPGDPENIVYNPAGTAFIKKHTVSMSYLRGIDGGGNGLASFSMHLLGFTLTPAFQYYNGGQVDLKFSDGSSRTVTAAEDRIVLLSGAFELLPGLGVGATAKFSKFNLGEEASATGRHFDVGALYKTSFGLSAGVSRQNIGNDIKFEDVGDPPPSATRAGVAYVFDVPSVYTVGEDDMGVYTNLAADWVGRDKEKEAYQVGAEVGMKGESLLFVLRGGYLFNRDQENVTFGLGGRQGSFSVDYAYGNSPDLQSTHQFTVGYSF